MKVLERVLESLTCSKVDINPFLPKCSLLMPLKSSENQRFFDIFRSIERGALRRRGLTTCTSVLCLGFSTTDVMYIICQMQEKHFIRKRIYFAFVDLGKASEWVPRSILWCATRKLGINE